MLTKLYWREHRLPTGRDWMTATIDDSELSGGCETARCLHARPLASSCCERLRRLF